MLLGSLQKLRFLLIWVSLGVVAILSTRNKLRTLDSHDLRSVGFAV
jgi:hypothetical protein